MYWRIAVFLVALSMIMPVSSRAEENSFLGLGPLVRYFSTIYNRRRAETIAQDRRTLQASVTSCWQECRAHGLGAACTERGYSESLVNESCAAEGLRTDHGPTVDVLAPSFPTQVPRDSQRRPILPNARNLDSYSASLGANTFYFNFMHDLHREYCRRGANNNPGLYTNDSNVGLTCRDLVSIQACVWKIISRQEALLGAANIGVGLKMVNRCYEYSGVSLPGGEGLDELVQAREVYSGDNPRFHPGYSGGAGAR